MWSIVPYHDLSYGNVSPIRHFTPCRTRQSSDRALAVLGGDGQERPDPIVRLAPGRDGRSVSVSALIHAATMVTAGVYLIARSMPLLSLAPGVLLLIAVIGCATALLSAAIAVTQTDLKRVLAYSTVSQLGYMFMALGSGVGNVGQLAVVAAMFHLFTHAFFKALLFLAAGSVMHAMGDVIDMRRFGGLRHRLPYTCWTSRSVRSPCRGSFRSRAFSARTRFCCAIGAASHGGSSVYILIYWVAIFTAFLTAFYAGRAFFMTFWGPEKLPSPDDPEAPPGRRLDAHGGTWRPSTGHAAIAHEHGSHVGHESPPIMTYPLFALAACTALIGLVCLIAGPFAGTTEWFAHHLHATFAFESLGHEEHAFDWLTASSAPLAGLSRARTQLRDVRRAQPAAGADWSSGSSPLYEASLHKFGVDELYDGWSSGRPVPWRSSATFSTTTWSTAGDWCGQAAAVVRPRRAGPVPERADPVLRGGLGAECSGAPVDSCCFFDPVLVPAVAPRIDGWQHSWRSRSCFRFWGAWFWS